MFQNFLAKHAPRPPYKDDARQRSHPLAAKQLESSVQIILGPCDVYFSCELDLTLSR